MVDPSWRDARRARSARTTRVVIGSSAVMIVGMCAWFASFFVLDDPLRLASVAWFPILAVVILCVQVATQRWARRVLPAQLRRRPRGLQVFYGLALLAAGAFAAAKSWQAAPNVRFAPLFFVPALLVASLMVTLATDFIHSLLIAQEIREKN